MASKPELERLGAWAILFLGAIAIVFAVSLTVSTYMPCPFWDEWVVIDQIGKGNGPTSWAWLWSQQNEHRIVLPRLLIWLDLFAFGGRNISLFAETLLFQLFHLAAICFAIERYAAQPVFIRRCLQGIFTFALFHPNQLENFTWAFQFSFVLPFVMASCALLAIAFHSQWKSRRLAIAVAVVTPIVAAVNLAGGLLIGPAATVLAAAKRLPKSVTALLVGASALLLAVYLFGYHRVGYDLTPGAELSRGKDLFVYVLTFLGASWGRLFHHKERAIAFLSLAVYLTILIPRLRRRDEITNLEWFLLAECAFIIAIAFATGLGRIQYGVGQAFASRYQTPAMMYWASLGSLVLLSVYGCWPNKILFAETGMFLVMLLSLLTFPWFWTSANREARTRGAACLEVMGPQFKSQAARTLYENPDAVEHARPFLRRIWSHEIAR